MRATIVHLGRPTALGEHRRVASWRSILDAGGWSVAEVRLLPELRATPLTMASQAMRAAAPGRAAPESAVWSWRDATNAIAATSPDAVICVTARAYHRSFAAAPWRVGLDFVDRLSVSYADRARIVSRPDKQALYRALAVWARAVERTRPGAPVRIAAGAADAEALDAAWVPNVVTLPELGTSAPDHDVVFVGTLSYAPNIAAVERLARVWPDVLAGQPGATALIAGAGPSSALRALAERSGWTLEPDFADGPSVLARARVAVAPLEHASGTQNKVLEAAASGLPQVVDVAALAGLDAAFPIRATDSDAAFVDALVDLLGDVEAQRVEGDAGRRHVEEHYVAAAWAAWPADHLR
jgi:glycosyltransferase involved in cell wall biosynthesis